jgi:hypothetical protein
MSLPPSSIGSAFHRTPEPTLTSAGVFGMYVPKGHVSRSTGGITAGTIRIIGGRARPATRVPFRLTDPQPDRLRFRATIAGGELLGHRTDRFPLRPVLVTMIQHHPNRPLTQLIRILPLTWHDSILSKSGASTEPGVVQTVASSICSLHSTCRRVRRSAGASSVSTRCSGDVGLSRRPSESRLWDALLQRL